MYLVICFQFRDCAAELSRRKSGSVQKRTTVEKCCIGRSRDGILREIRAVKEPKWRKVGCRIEIVTAIINCDDHIFGNLGGLAQLVERVLSMHEVVSSILTFSILLLLTARESKLTVPFAGQA